MFPWLECLGFPPFCSALQSFAWHPNTVCQIFSLFFLFIPDCTEIQDGNAIRRFCSLIWTGKLWKSLHIKIVYEKEIKLLGIHLQYKVWDRKIWRIFMQQSRLCQIYIAKPGFNYLSQILSDPQSHGTILFVNNYFHLERSGLPKNEIDAVFSKCPTLILKGDALQCTFLLEQRQEPLCKYLQILKNDFLKHSCVFNEP